MFLKGAEGGLRATDEIYDLLIEQDCKVGDHSNALTIAYEMEAAGRMATTFHFNCLLSVQVLQYIYDFCWIRSLNLNILKKENPTRNVIFINCKKVEASLRCNFFISFL